MYEVTLKISDDVFILSDRSLEVLFNRVSAIIKENIVNNKCNVNFLSVNFYEEE